MGKASEIWKEIKPKIGEMLMAVNDMEQSFDKAVKEAYEQGINDAREGKASCQFCEYEMCSDRVDPCRICACNYMNFFEPKKQEKKEQIQVGDEVVGTYTGGEETEPFVIIRKIPEIDPIYYFGIYSKSGEFCQGGLKLKKTGRHFPEIAEALQKMKG